MSERSKLAGLFVAVAFAAAAAQQTIPTKPAQDSKAPSTKSQGTKPATPKPEVSKPAGSDPSAKPATPGTKPSATQNWKKYCAPEGDYCVKYPPAWEPLGDPTEAGGLVVAPPQADKPAAQWSQVTVTATDLPDPVPGKERPSFDELIAVVMESMRPGVSPQTLARKQMLVGGLPAQALKLQYDDEDGQTWIEAIVLIDADDVIYSLALRTTPGELPSLEPQFQHIVQSWRLVESEGQ